MILGHFDSLLVPDVTSRPDLDGSISGGSEIANFLFVLLESDAIVFWLLFDPFFRVDDVNACDHVLMALNWFTIDHILRPWWILPYVFLSRLDVIKVLFLHGR